MPHIQTELNKDEFRELKLFALENSLSLKKILHDAILLYIKIYPKSNSTSLSNLNIEE